MKEQERCLLEIITEKNELPLISVKNGIVSDELVFNLEYLEDFRLKDVFGILDNNNIRDSLIPHIVGTVCDRCKKCTPEIKDKSRLIRHGYSYDSDNPLLFVIEEHKSRTIPSLGRAVFIDDMGLANDMSTYYAGKGFSCYTINTIPHANVAGDREHLAVTKEILALHPDFVFSDKGLGYLSGIEIIKCIRRMSDSIITVLVTGEWDTRETHKVAHFFIEKPIMIKDTDVILGITN